MCKKFLFFVLICIFCISSSNQIIAQCLTFPSTDSSECDMANQIEFIINNPNSSHTITYCTAYQRKSDLVIINNSNWVEVTSEIGDNSIKIEPQWLELLEIMSTAPFNPDDQVIAITPTDVLTAHNPSSLPRNSNPTGTNSSLYSNGVCDLSTHTDEYFLIVLFYQSCTELAGNLYRLKCKCCYDSGKVDSNFPNSGIQPTVIDLQGADKDDCLGLSGTEQLCCLNNSSCKTARTTYDTNNVTLANYPNPFSNQVNLQYQLPEQAQVSLDVFDIQGRLVNRLVAEQQQKAGKYEHLWQTQQLLSGIYYYQLTVNNITYTRKIVKM